MPYRLPLGPDEKYSIIKSMDSPLKKEGHCGNWVNEMDGELLIIATNDLKYAFECFLNGGVICRRSSSFDH